MSLDNSDETENDETEDETENKSVHSPPRPPRISLAAVLANEFLGLEDLDNNGKVYGYHFKIEEDYISRPPHKPILLTKLEEMSEWRNPKLRVKWIDFLISYYEGSGGLVDAYERDENYNLSLNFVGSDNFDLELSDNVERIS